MRKNFLNTVLKPLAFGLVALAALLGVAPNVPIIGKLNTSVETHAAPPGSGGGGIDIGGGISIGGDILIGINTTSENITLGNTVMIEVSVYNSNDTTLIWSTDNNNVKLYSDEDCTSEVGSTATSTNTVYAKGVAVGSTTVSATSNADKTKIATCNITVEPVPTSATTVKHLSGNYYYTYGTANADNGNLYIIYVFTGDPEKTEYIKINSNGSEITNENTRITEVYKSIKFGDDSELNISALNNGAYTDNYFVAVRLKDSTKTDTPDTNKFEFVTVSVAGGNEHGNDTNDD